MSLLWQRQTNDDNVDDDEKKNRVQIARAHFALCEKNAVSIALFSKLFFELLELVAASVVGWFTYWCST